MKEIQKQRVLQLRKSIKENRNKIEQKLTVFVWRSKVAQLSLLLYVILILISTIANNPAECAKIVQAFEVSYKNPNNLEPETANVSENETKILNNIHEGNKRVQNNNCTNDNSRLCSHHQNFNVMEFPPNEKDVADRLIKKWAPMVWLAPEEKFMPLGVEEFLEHVHPIEKDKTFIPGMPIGDQSEKAYLVTNTKIDELLKNGTSFIYGRNPNKEPVPVYAVVTLCDRIQDKMQKYRSESVHEGLLKDDFQLIGDSPRGPYIPLSFDKTEEVKTTMRRSSRLYPVFKKVKRSYENEIVTTAGSPSLEEIPIPKYSEMEDDAISSDAIGLSAEEFMTLPTRLGTQNDISTKYTTNNSNENVENVNKFIANLADNVKFSMDIGNNIDNYDDDHINGDDVNTNKKKYPSFHVTYWMFYPYSQGKTMCTLNLGPLGHIPFPALYGFCLGQRKDIGSHIGDWEHMSLYFNGSPEPEALYVSAHDAGAYYIFNSLTGSFEFKKQETRKGILQRPNFPKTVTTFNNHPVLFSAKGSHGLWTAPGKHRFVKVARLYDINGFGTLWNTRKALQISYENMKYHGRSLLPTWLSFKGKWGNPKSNCHPFRRIGLNFCEYTDGPTGIPLKKSHFECGATYR